MPRRTKPDPTAVAVGQRIRSLRIAAGLNLEQLAQQGLGSKGHLSNIERGLVRPTVTTLKTLADHLGVLPLDLVNIPAEGPRQEFVELTRRLSATDLQVLLKEVAALESGPPMSDTKVIEAPTERLARSDGENIP